MRFLGFLILSASLLYPATPSTSKGFEHVTFEPNVGQANGSVKFLARTARATLWLTQESATFGVHGKSGRAVVKLRFEGANHAPRIEGEGRLPGVSNYIIGQDEKKWHKDVPQFAKVRYRELYPGIDAVFYTKAGQLEYDFILKPGADPSRIRLAFDGADRVHADSKGDLVVKIGDVEIRNHKPEIYQGDRLVAGRYRLLGKKAAGFAVDPYDTAQPLVIDPVLSYATFLGGSLGDYAFAIARDAQGFLYLTGGTDSANFPTQSGYSSGRTNPYANVFVSKIDPTASGPASLVFSTYFGGNAYEYAQGIAVDSASNVYIVGTTYSSNLPLQSAFQTALAGAFGSCADPVFEQAYYCPDAFVTKFSPGGNSLLYSSYLGGALDDYGTSIALDAAGNAYVTGKTLSSNFPVIGSPYRATIAGASDAFVSKISSSGALLYSTYFGGESSEGASAIAVDGNGVVAITGYTFSSALGVGASAFQSSTPATGTGPNGPLYNGFVARLDPAIPGGPGLAYATYLGGSSPRNGSNGLAIAINSTGNIFVAGMTDSPNFPVTAGAYQSSFLGVATSSVTDPGNVFVTELDPSQQGSAQLVYSTYLGGQKNDSPGGIAVDAANRITVAGNTNSPTFPVTSDALQGSLTASLGMGFLARIDPSQSGASSLTYSSFLGGSLETFPAGVAMDANGNTVAIGGETFSQDAPVTPTAFQSAYGGTELSSTGTLIDGDAYVAQFDLTTQLNAVTTPLSFTVTNTAVSPGSRAIAVTTPSPALVNLTATADSPWIQVTSPGKISSGSPASIGVSVNAGAFAASGNYKGVVSISSNGSPPVTVQVSAAVSIPIAIPPTIVSGTNFRGATGQAFSTTLTGTGGVQPYTWQATGLPSWLGLDASTGILSSSSAQAGTFNFSVKLIDGAGTQAGPLAITIVVQGAATVTQFFPHLADGGEWQTEFLITNPNGSSITVSLVFHLDSPAQSLPVNSGSGGALVSTNSIGNIVIPPNGSVVFRTGGSPSAALITGWVEIITTAPVGGQALFRRHAGDGNYYEGSVPLISSATTHFSFPFDSNTFTNGAPFLTGAAFANPNPSLSATVTCTAYDPNGAVLGSNLATATLAGFGHTQAVLQQTGSLQSALSGTRGLLVCSSTQPIGVLALRFFGNFALSSVPVTGN